MPEQTIIQGKPWVLVDAEITLPGKVAGETQPIAGYKLVHRGQQKRTQGRSYAYLYPRPVRSGACAVLALRWSLSPHIEACLARRMMLYNNETRGEQHHTHTHSAWRVTDAQARQFTKDIAQARGLIETLLINIIPPHAQYQVPGPNYRPDQSQPLSHWVSGAPDTPTPPFEGYTPREPRWTADPVEHILPVQNTELAARRLKALFGDTGGNAIIGGQD